MTPGLFAAVRAPGYVPAPNPQQSVTAPQALTVTFTNGQKTALPPDPVAWNAQQALPEFSSSRYDPYLPVWLNWQARLDPLARGADGTYAPDTLCTRFSLDEPDAIDLTYPLPAKFTTDVPVTYSGTVVLSKKPFAALTTQIDTYIADFPTDAADPELGKARDILAGRKVLSQGLDTFNAAQTLRTTIPQIPVEDLVVYPDPLTGAIASAATATPGDSWYGTGFNSLAPISTGPLALANFGPLRAGFLDISSLELVDVFGQVMTLATAGHVQGDPLAVTPSRDLSPAAGDSANAHKAYLPPRLIAPARADAHWLSAAHNDDVPAVKDDFVEMNDHPATSPVCGWIMPNHLDASLAFYDADGQRSARSASSTTATSTAHAQGTSATRTTTSPSTSGPSASPSRGSTRTWPGSCGSSTTTTGRIRTTTRPRTSSRRSWRRSTTRTRSSARPTSPRTSRSRC